MLTVQEINEVSFGKAGFSGYKPEDVDEFIDSVVESFKELEANKDESSKKIAELTARNSELQEKLSILAGKLETYRKDEDSIKDALITAQMAARGAVKDAEKKAEIILANADHQAKITTAEAQKQHKILVDDAREEAAKASRFYAMQIDEKKTELEEIKKQVTAFRASLLEMYKKHLDCIDHIPSFKIKDNLSNEKIAPKPQNVPVQNPELLAKQVKETKENQTEMISRQAALQPKNDNYTTRETVVNQVPAEKFNVVIPQHQVSYQEEPQKKLVPKSPTNQKTGSLPRPIQEERNINGLGNNNPMMQKVNYAQSRHRTPAPAIPDLTYESDDLTDIGINTNTFRSIPEPLLKEKKTGYSNLEFGEGVDVTTR